MTVTNFVKTYQRVDNLMNFHNWLDYTNFAILSTILLVLCFYAWDTNKIQKATNKQVELLIKPLLSIMPISENGETFFVVMNIGNGTAININFETMYFENDQNLN